MALQTERLRTIEQVQAFVVGTEPVDCTLQDRESAYDFVRRTLVAFGYHRLGKSDRGWVRRYIVKVTGFSPAQLTRLVARHAETGAVVDLRARNSGRPFETRYGPIDIRRLAEVDEAFGQMSGHATCEILRRAFEVHGDPGFERLAGISRSHVYNLRGSRTYRAMRTTWTKTKGSSVAIAVRKAPKPNGVPGFLRVDSVHQGDRDGVKGVYIVNLVDEVTQYEYIGVVLGISERLLIPALEALLLLFPFPVLGFHADERLRVHQPPGGRSAAEAARRRVHEVARPSFQRQLQLVDAKNAHAVRWHLGHGHIPARVRGRRERFRTRASVAVRQLPPPQPVRDGVPRPQGQGAAQVLARGRQDALREAEVAAGGGRPPEVRGCRSRRSTGSPSCARTCRPPARSTRRAPTCSGGSTRLRRRDRAGPRPAGCGPARVSHRLPTAAFMFEGTASVDRPWKTLREFVVHR